MLWLKLCRGAGFASGFSTAEVNARYFSNGNGADAVCRFRRADHYAALGSV